MHSPLSDLVEAPYSLTSFPPPNPHFLYRSQWQDEGEPDLIVGFYITVLPLSRSKIRNTSDTFMI